MKPTVSVTRYRRPSSSKLRVVGSRVSNNRFRTETSAPASDPPVGLELRLTGAARAHAAAEPLEVLPHPAHAREVVLELRELDLELSLGADGVLREDVEDQLRAVHDPRAERVLERPLLRRVELVVDEQHLCTGLLERRLELHELSLADVRAGVGPGAVLHDVADGLDARGPRELAELAELLLGVGAVGEDGDREPALRFRARSWVGLTRRHAAIMPPRRQNPVVAFDLARRTLELVNVRSETWHEAELASLVRSIVPLPLRYDEDHTLLFQEARSSRPLVVFAGHLDTV